MPEESTASDQPVFVLSVAVVRWGIEQLREAKIHTFFPAYLEIRRTATISESATDLHPDWGKLGELLEMPGGPPRKPYFRPFWHGAWKSGQDWMNENIAGSYAPSSIRKVPLNVVEPAGSGYSLRQNHAALALQHLLYGEPVEAVPLAAFLYRDFGFRTDGPSIAPLDLVTVFQRDFGYDDPAAANEFNTLYRTSIPERTDWFEPVASPDDEEDE
jgi:hypothetical protein